MRYATTHMAVKHTPGPWKFREYAQTDEMLAEARSLGLEPTRYINNDGSVPVSAAETGICTVSCQTPFRRGSGHRAECDERDANARLIAAAPELLEALQHAHDCLAASGWEGDPRMHKIIAALDKAEGRT